MNIALVCRNVAAVFGDKNRTMRCSGNCCCRKVQQWNCAVQKTTTRNRLKTYSIKVDIYTDNSVVVMYINGEYGTTQRIYGLQKNCWSVNGYGGNVTVSDVKVSSY